MVGEEEAATAGQHEQALIGPWQLQIAMTMETVVAATTNAETEERAEHGKRVSVVKWVATQQGRLM